MAISDSRIAWLFSIRSIIWLKTLAMSCVSTGPVTAARTPFRSPPARFMVWTRAPKGAVRRSKRRLSQVSRSAPNTAARTTLMPKIIAVRPCIGALSSVTCT